jgi:putative transposase
MLAKSAGVTRYCYNWGLAKWNEMYERGEKCDGYLLQRLWTKERPEWSKEVARVCQAKALMNLGAAFSAFFRKRAKHPAFHKKGRKDSFYVTNDKGWLKGDWHVHLPNIGDVRMAEKLRFNGEILRYVVSKVADNWYVSITVELYEDIRPTDSDSAVGIDAGIKHWAVTSDGDVLDRPKSITRLEKRLRNAEREKSRRKKGSRNRRKSIRRIARLHHMIRCVKMDAVHKFTSRIAKNHGVVCCENLCVKGMARSIKCLRKGVHDSCMGELRMLLSYKAKRYVEIDRWFPSSKRCSRCGHVKDELGLSERTYRCEACGNVLDRDYNASVNIRDEGLRIFTEGHSESACGGR